MIDVVRGLLALSLVAGGFACGDDGHDHEADGEHSHEGPGGCGQQENCAADAPELSSGPMATGDNGASFMVHIPSEYMHAEDSTRVSATMMLHFMRGEETLANTEVKLYTWSEDCGHEGPTPPVMATTNDQGMVMFDAQFAHGGPWSIMAEVGGDEVGLELCIPGESHGGGEHSGQMGGDAGMVDHTMHMQ